MSGRRRSADLAPLPPSARAARLERRKLGREHARPIPQADIGQACCGTRPAPRRKPNTSVAPHSSTISPLRSRYDLSPDSVSCWPVPLPGVGHRAGDHHPVPGREQVVDHDPAGRQPRRPDRRRHPVDPPHGRPALVHDHRPVEQERQLLDREGLEDPQVPPYDVRIALFRRDGSTDPHARCIPKCPEIEKAVSQIDGRKSLAPVDPAGGFSGAAAAVDWLRPAELVEQVAVVLHQVPQLLGVRQFARAGGASRTRPVVVPLGAQRPLPLLQ